MPFDEVFDEAVTAAEDRETLDWTNDDERDAFEREFRELMTDDDGNLRDEFPSLNDIDPDERKDYFDFLDEYDLWDEFRDDLERDYEPA